MQEPFTSHSRDLRFDIWRLLAVLLVVLHHLAPEKFPFAYLGVDIFIVIAGYLSVESVIHHGGWFFYIKNRIKRIYPELIVLLSICAILAPCLLSNQRLRDVGSTIVCSMLSITNILFSLKSGYVYGRSDSLSNPLLHLWSLSLEIQYYVIAPFIVGLLIIRKSSQFVIGFGVVIIAISAWLSLGHGAASYYLITSRGWEFAAGVIAWWIANRFSRPYVGRVLVFWIASVLVFFIAITNLDAFYLISPRWLVVLVSVLALGFSAPFRDATENARDRPDFLVVKPTHIRGSIQLLGYETYAVYLAHYPAIIFARQVSLIYDAQFWPSFIIFFICLSFLISNCGGFVRKSMEKKVGWQRVVLLSSVIMFVGAFFWAFPGMRQNFNINGGDPGKITNEGERLRLDNVCNTSIGSSQLHECVYGHGPKTIALIGDSFGASLMPGFDLKSYGNDFTVHQFTKNECPFVYGLLTVPDAKCVEFNIKIADRLSELKPDVILVQYRWWSYAYRTPNYNIKGAPGYVFCLEEKCDNAYAPTVDTILIDAFVSSIARLKSIGSRIVVVSPTPEYGEMIPQVVSLVRARTDLDTPVIDLVERKESSDISKNIYELMTAVPGIDGANVRGVFAPFGGRFRAYQSGEVLFYDGNHLTQYAAQLVWQELYLHLK